MLIDVRCFCGGGELCVGGVLGGGGWGGGGGWVGGSKLYYGIRVTKYDQDTHRI